MIIGILLAIITGVICALISFKLALMLSEKRLQKRILNRVKKQKEDGYRYIVPVRDATTGKDIGKEIDLVSEIEKVLFKKSKELKKKEEIDEDFL